ncbi:alpha-galactosidase [Tunturiibacter gelidoferens]|uniref:Alpha-galactosidase n=1 Tax=Tunturiibacter gelidiferens TaxID=3069689 RepID=A0A9X0U786_9BACT|nr:alpha-galactosidase [Edaphobacter lichenicola]MBB5330727.1 alpha-galactosidase [Edaphobacter lichenicola]
MIAEVARMIGRGTNAGTFCAAAKHRRKLRFIVLLCIAFGSTHLPLFAEGQSNAALIHFDSQAQVFRMDTADMSYVFGINEKKQLQAIYWGKRLSSADTFAMPHSDPGVSSFESSTNTTRQEFVGWGGGLYVEPDLKVTFPDGNRDLVLEYVSHRIDGNQLTILLKDISREVYVELQYQIDASTGVLTRSAQVHNRTSAPLTVEEIASATWNLPHGTDYRLRYLTGRWAGEWSLREQIVQPGKTILESRRGSTGAQNNPWFAIDKNGSNDQEYGDVWFGALGWSGSWQISIEQDATEQVRVTGGPNRFDFGYRLAPGEHLQSPDFYAGYSRDGIGGASRLLHRFEISNILPHAPSPKLRPILYNSWEATEFKVDEAGQEALAEKAASIGIERFVVDDGWFGQRSSDHAGLGDWYVNPVKFPHGLKPLIDKVHSLGMDFGLWVEPEMVNPDSDLYRKHPDWTLNFTGRPRTEGRNQLMLNLARPDVRAYVFQSLDKLLNENDIAFLKWDYNRNWSEPGWPAVAPEDEKKVYIAYIQNLYSILDELRTKHPHVEIESCSGGGSRVDLGIMYYTDEVWPSDNTDAFDRLLIQDGFTYAYAPGVMMAWVTDSPTWVNKRSLSLEYRFLSSMQGSLGVGANLNNWKPEDFATAKKMVTQYKQIRETVQRGSLYRLISPQKGSEQSVTESVSEDQRHAVAFAFLHSSQMLYPFPTIYLRGLKTDAMYRIDALDGKLSKNLPPVASGAFWMEHGVDVELRGDFQAAAFRLEIVER